MHETQQSSGGRKRDSGYPGTHGKPQVPAILLHDDGMIPTRQLERLRPILVRLNTINGDRPSDWEFQRPARSLGRR